MSAPKDVQRPTQRLTLQDFEIHGRAGSSQGLRIISKVKYVANNHDVSLLDGTTVEKFCVGVGGNIWAFVDGGKLPYCEDIFYAQYPDSELGEYIMRQIPQFPRSPHIGIRYPFNKATTYDQIIALLHYIHLKVVLILSPLKTKPLVDELDLDPQVLQYFADFCKQVASEEQNEDD
ncbi:hypothetical protein P171DRAFT_491931 [Karstenula rhodostoma CBS 690.94]|uniref:Uncharacterized protein n=1 Tax=Karstenula rhodostoma CBS 690.94 TaxID=1392251 RepID=A0A9P4P3E6_9PLEO|nr:hypothetical protein P171DRAFT_491931 [Karstenula rhodostoma CBS 690.94]